MKLEINLPTGTVKAIYDLLTEKYDERSSQRYEAIEKIHNCHPNAKAHWETLIRGYSYDVDLLELVTDIFAEALKKEGAL